MDVLPQNCLGEAIFIIQSYSRSVDKLGFTEGGKQVLFQVSTHQPPNLNKMWKEYKKIKEKSALLQKPHNTLR